MSIAVIIQFAALAVIAGIGVCVVYAIFEMREVYADQREKFVRSVAAVEEFHRLQPEFISLLQRVESDGHALQKIALQIEVAVAALKNTISSESQRALPQPRQAPALVLPPAPEPEPQNCDYIRLRKEVVSRDPQVRLSVLKGWLSINALAILHRASRGCNSANELIANIPVYLEAEAEVVDGCVLVIGTHGHAEKLAIPIRDVESSSGLTEWFEAASNGGGTRLFPAVLIRSDGHFELISKGSAHEVLSRRTHV